MLMMQDERMMGRERYSCLPGYYKPMDNEVRILPLVEVYVTAAFLLPGHRIAQLNNLMIVLLDRF